MHVVSKAWAFFKRDLVTDVSYRLSFALEAVHVFLAIAAYHFLARLLEGKTQGYAPFPFILIGTAVSGCMATSLVCFAQAVRGSQTGGTLKAVLSTRTSPSEFIMLSSIYPSVRAELDGAVYLVVGTLFGLSLTRVNLVAAVLTFGFSLLAFMSIGIISAAFTLVFKRGDPLLWIFVSLSSLLGGVFYPVEALPQALQKLAHFLPMTHTLSGMRAALLNRSTPAELLPEIRALALFVVISLPVSLVAFNLGVQRARVTGTLNHL